MPLFVTVTPGTTVTNSTTLDPTTLNLLGTPSIDVVGTVDGGSLSLAAGSVGTTQLAANAVTNAKMATMASNTIKGNNTGATAVPSDLSVSDVKSLLAINPAGGLENSSTNIQIANSGVTYAKIQNVAATSLIGNPTGSAAAPTAITLGTGLSFSGTTLNSSVKTKVSGLYALPNPTSHTPIVFNHDLGAVPDQFQIFLECVTPHFGYAAGQRIPGDFVVGNDSFPIGAFYADSTSVTFVRANNNLFIWQTDGVTFTYIPLSDESKWNFRISASKYT